MGAAITLSFLNLLWNPTGATAPAADQETGRSIYQFYCYQCHGYAGDARTLASTYLSPRPRDFTAASENELTVDEITRAILQGKPNTAMVSFATVLSMSDAHAVALYIHDAFMSSDRRPERYHSGKNGWPNHERYASAFPFIDGTISLSEPWERLTAEQTAGRRLFENACISCHDQPLEAAPDGPVWELRAVSLPRRHYSHRISSVDMISGASPYAQHEIAPQAKTLSSSAKAGKTLFEKNCAFCHAVDGTGRNWIGSFLNSRPRDLTDPDQLVIRDRNTLAQRIRDGIPGTSMPAWRHVLSDAEIMEIAAYIEQALVRSAD